VPHTKSQIHTTKLFNPIVHWHLWTIYIGNYRQGNYVYYYFISSVCDRTKLMTDLLMYAGIYLCFISCIYTSKSPQSVYHESLKGGLQQKILVES